MYLYNLFRHTFSHISLVTLPSVWNEWDIERSTATNLDKHLSRQEVWGLTPWAPCTACIIYVTSNNPMKVCNDGGIVNDERPMHPICLIHAGGPASKCAHRFQIQHLSELCGIRARIQDSRWPRDLTFESMDPMPARIVRFVSGSILFGQIWARRAKARNHSGLAQRAPQKRMPVW